MDGIIRKHDATVLGLLQNAYSQKNVNITMDRADIAFRPTCNLANSHRFVITLLG